MKKTAKKPFGRLWFMLALTVAACAVSLLMGRQSGSVPSAFTVALMPESGMTILSENPVTVEAGQTASFRVALENGYFPGKADKCRYEDGNLYLDDVRYSQTLRFTPRRLCALTVREEDKAYIELLSEGPFYTGDTVRLRVSAPEHYRAEKLLVNSETHIVPVNGLMELTVYEDSAVSAEISGEPVVFTASAYPFGAVTGKTEKDAYRYGDVVTLTSSCDREARFSGWSEGAPLREGGSFLSYEDELVFILTGDSVVYANYSTQSTYSVIVNLNGGSDSAPFTRENLSAGEAVYLPVESDIPARDGYRLIGYNTRADGSGTHYAPASPVYIGEYDVSLYCSWLPEPPESALSYRERDGYIVVSGAKGDIGDTLVLPERIGGERVRVLDDGSFCGNDTLKTVVLPVGLTYIGENALSGCGALSTVYLPDTIEVMGKGTLEDCPSFAHLRMLASGNERVYEKCFDTTLADKYARLLNTRGKRIILVAGSSANFGLNSALLKERFPDYEIINFGGSYLFGMKPLLELLTAHIHEGDVLIFAPEYYKQMYCSGVSSEPANNWLYLESNYNMLDDMDMRAVKSTILDSAPRYLNERRKVLPGKMQAGGNLSRAAHNEYGDVARVRTHAVTRGITPPENDLLSAEGVEFFKHSFEEITSLGGTCLFSFPPVSVGGSSKRALSADFAAFTEKLIKAFEGAAVTVISDATDYIFPADEFYDNAYHMTSEGAIVRTNQLIDDLERYGLAGRGDEK